jgi:predicted nucleic acid-binding Zn ribbon protein
MTLKKGYTRVLLVNKKHVFFSVYVCGEECQKTLELRKELKRLKRVMVNVISLAKIVVQDVSKEF